MRRGRRESFFFEQKPAYEISLGLVRSGMCIRDGHTVIMKASTTLAGETEARSVTSTLWVRGVFVPGFESAFSLLALAFVAITLARVKRDDE